MPRLGIALPARTLYAEYAGDVVLFELDEQYNVIDTWSLFMDGRVVRTATWAGPYDLYVYVGTYWVSIYMAVYMLAQFVAAGTVHGMYRLTWRTTRTGEPRVDTIALLPTDRLRLAHAQRAFKKSSSSSLSSLSSSSSSSVSSPSSSVLAPTTLKPVPTRMNARTNARMNTNAHGMDMRMMDMRMMDMRMMDMRMGTRTDYHTKKLKFKVL